MVGQTLLHYRIESKLGAGGMGIVYRARDTHLDRLIALKVLPAAASLAPECKGRLAQEAKAASALNHPNIVTIYDIGSDRIDGEGVVDFIAMEYVSGKTLDRVIANKGLKLNTALRYAIQIADAIATAHAAGIIHRDLKPANLMINDQGMVKVLDFGLAKWTQPEKPDAFAQTESVHVGPDLRTEAGTILGTVAYMSPEQAEGKEIDARSDIFTFGSVLYEMLTGQRAFAGDSKLSVLATILQKDIPPVRDVVKDLPREIDRMIARCLQKDPRRRWQSMADLKLGLEELLEDLEANRLASPESTVPARRWYRRWQLPLILALIVGPGVGAYLAGRTHSNSPATFQRLTFRRGDISAARFAPDGKTIIYSSEWDGAPNYIFSTVPGNRESRSLGLPEARLLALSSAGELAILLGGGSQGTLARVSLAGGVPREVLEAVTEADWSPDGTTMAVVRTVNGRNRIEYPIGKALYETDGRAPYCLRVSPKGDLIAFFEQDPNVGDFSVSIVGPNTPKKILSGGWRGTAQLAWSSAGDEVWFSATQLGADPWVRAVSLSGKVRAVGQAPGWMNLQDIDRSGRVLMNAMSMRVAVSFLSAPEKVERDLSWLDTSYVSDLSSDGKQMLFLELSYGEGRNTAMYFRKTDGSPAVLLGYGNRPSLSPDGKSVVAIRDDSGQSQLVILPTGAGETKLLTIKDMRYESAEWLPNGQEILFLGSDSGRRVRTYIQDLAGGAARPVTPEGVKASHVSPDGKFFVTLTPDHFALLPIAGGKIRVIATAEPGERAVRWSVDGQYLFIRRPMQDGRRMQLLRLNVATGQKQVWKDLGPADPVGAAVISVAITPDGKSYAYSYQRGLSNLYLLEGVK
jgi:serine/threonine protein kinase